MGLLDLPGLIYGAVDRTVAPVLPPVWRLVLWAMLGAVASMLLYKWLSPQGQIAAIKQRGVETRRQLFEHDDDLASAWPLIRAQFGAAFHRIRLVLPATLIATLPIITLLIWLDGTYARDLPETETPPIEITPGDYRGSWQQGVVAPRITVRGEDGNFVANVPFPAAIPEIEKRHWWNLLIGNPAGYLPEQGPVERVSVQLPEKSYIPFGPDWARSWLAVFLPIFLITSLCFHRIARIQ